MVVAMHYYHHHYYHRHVFANGWWIVVHWIRLQVSPSTRRRNTVLDRAHLRNTPITSLPPTIDHDPGEWVLVQPLERNRRDKTPRERELATKRTW